MSFIQDENGTPVDGKTAQAIRTHAAELFYTIATLQGDDVTPIWGQVDLNAKDFYRAKICQFWPNLQMCAFNWKADAIATVVYRYWYKCFTGEGSRKRYLQGAQEEQNSWSKRLRQDPQPPSLPSPSQLSSSSQSSSLQPSSSQLLLSSQSSLPQSPLLPPASPIIPLQAPTEEPLSPAVDSHPNALDTSQRPVPVSAQLPKQPT